MKFSILIALVVCTLICCSLLVAGATPATVDLGTFENGYDGWELVTNPDDPTGGQYYSLSRISFNGSTCLKMTWSPWGYTEEEYPDPLYSGWAPCIRRHWDSTGQAQMFDTTQPVTLTIDFLNASGLGGHNGPPWNYYIMAGFSDEPFGADGKQVLHMAYGGWMYWPTSTLTLTAAQFGVSNERFAKLNHLQVNLTDVSFNNTGSDPMSVIVKNVRLTGTAGTPLPAGNLKSLPDGSDVNATGVVTALLPNANMGSFSLTLGDFQMGEDGWGIGGEGTSARTMGRVSVNGRYFLKGTLSPTSTAPLNYDGYLYLAKGWDTTGQAAKFDTTKPMSLMLDVARWAGEEPWWCEVVAQFAAEANSPQHRTGWMYWPNGTMTLTPTNFGVTNDVFATLTSLQVVYDQRAAWRQWDGPYQANPLSIGIDDVRLTGTAAAPNASVSLGKFDVDFNGWAVGGDGTSARTIERVQKDGTTYLKGTISPISTNPITYDGYLLLTKSWDSTNQAAPFDMNYPVNLVFDCTAWPNEAAWFFEVHAWFASEAGLPMHNSGWLFWPTTPNYTISAGTFGVSDETMASLCGLELALDTRAARRSFDGPVEANPLSLGFSSVRLDGRGFSSPAFYIEDTNRTSGIRVEKSSVSIGVDNTAVVTGKLATLPSGEKYIAASNVEPSTGQAIKPLGMINKTIGSGTTGGQVGVDGGTGLNTIGLLVRTTGLVDNSWGNTFYLYDGSNVKVKAVIINSTPLPAAGSYVSVTGVSSCEKDAAGLIQRVIYVTGVDVVTP